MNLWFVWEITVNIITTFGEAYMLYKQLGIQKGKRKIVLLGICINIAIISILNYIDIQSAIFVAPGFTIYATRFISTGLTFILTLIAFSGSMSEKILWTLVSMFIVCISDFVSFLIVIAITNATALSVAQFGSNRFVVTIIVLAFSLAAYYWLANIRSKGHKKMFIPLYIRYLLIAMLVLGTFSLDIITDNLFIHTPNQNPIMNVGEFMLSISFLFIILFSLILVIKVGVLTRENMEYALESQQSKLEHEYFNNMGIAIDELREAKHDIKHHMNAMQIMLAGENYNELSCYFEDMVGELDSKTDLILTQNSTLNSIIYSKALIMKANNIPFHHILLDTERLTISQYDLCSILGNLLDNAIEACVKLGKADGGRYIQLEIKKVENNLQIIVKNSFNGKYKKTDDNQFISLKTGSQHGLGLKHITRIVESCHGNMQMEPTETEFQVFVFLPCINTNREV